MGILTRKNIAVFSYLGRIALKHIYNFHHRTKGETIGEKKVFPNMLLSVKNDCFDERKRF